MANSIASMTGFARVDDAHNDRRWTWELKSVNSRGLELRFRLPQGFDDLELSIRKAAQQMLSRGAVNIALMMQFEEVDHRYNVNETALTDAINAITKVSEQMKCDLPRPEGILALRGVFEPSNDEDSEEERSALVTALLSSFSDALEQLVMARAAEGKALQSVLGGQVDQIESLTVKAAKLADVAPEAFREKISNQIKDLLGGAPISDERLAQEAVLLAVKSDIREELDRLNAHISSARQYIGAAGPVGRKLDFLTQEFNREANTLCSKVQDMALKSIGLEMKQVIDQMREQVQNIE